MLWDFGMKDQGAFGPHGGLVLEAVAAVPSTGGAVTSLLAMRVCVVVSAVLDVARTERHEEMSETKKKRFNRI